MAIARGFESICRSMGRAIDKCGAAIQGKYAVVEAVCPSVQNLSYGQAKPSFGESAFVAPSACISGNVTLAKNSSVWYNSIVRGDVAPVTIGENSHIKENVCIHVNHIGKEIPTIIGNNTIIDIGCKVHAVTIGDNCLVGAGSTILDNVVMESQSAVAPGSVVPPNKTIHSGEMWAGAPAQKIRDLSPDELMEITLMCKDSLASAGIHQVENMKSYKDLIEDDKEYKDITTRDLDYPVHPAPSGMNPERRGLIYDRLPAELDDDVVAPGIVRRPDYRMIQDMTFDLDEDDRKDAESKPVLPKY
ncbi:hypothetical protein WA158_003974 [Blastocystis sp. Blastoise]